MLLRCCCLCSPDQELTIRKGGELFAQQAGVEVELVCLHDPIRLYRRLDRAGGWDGVLVALPGALGMEAATRVREECPRTPLVWCSDDPLFALHSYRLGCAMFLLLPATAEQLAEALLRCGEALDRGTGENGGRGLGRNDIPGTGADRS